jgi:hypothetical protein
MPHDAARHPVGAADASDVASRQQVQEHTTVRVEPTVRARDLAVEYESVGIDSDALDAPG